MVIGFCAGGGAGVDEVDTVSRHCKVLIGSISRSEDSNKNIGISTKKITWKKRVNMRIEIKMDELDAYINVYRDLAEVVPEFKEIVEALETKTDLSTKIGSLSYTDELCTIEYSTEFVVEVIDTYRNAIGVVIPIFPKVGKFYRWIIKPIGYTSLVVIKLAARLFFKKEEYRSITGIPSMFTRISSIR